MNNAYQLIVRAACPVNDGDIDLYETTIRSQEMIPVERILEFFGQYKDQRIYQEELTQKAAVALGAEVETKGIHSGVLVTSIAP